MFSLKQAFDGLRHLSTRTFARRGGTSPRALWNSRAPLKCKFDGYVGGLIDCYFNDPASPFVKKTIEYPTRQNYTALCKAVRAEIGHMRIRDCDGRFLQDWFDRTANEGKIPMAHSKMGMFSTLLSFGGSILDSEECRRLSTIRSKMRFPMAKPRTERITYEQVVAHVAEAHLQGYASVAFADVLQFEGILRQKDAIGALVPKDEKEHSDLIVGEFKWVRGARWNELDDNLILHHVTSKKKKMVHISLRDAPLVMQELRRIAKIGADEELTRDMLPADGPLVVCEETGLPWQSYEFRRAWRQIANEAGIPKNVFSMDNRAGGVSEAIDAGVPPDHVRQAAAHATMQMTAHYTRNQQHASTSTLRGRVAHRAAQAATLVPALAPARAKTKARRKATPSPRRVSKSKEVSNADKVTA